MRRCFGSFAVLMMVSISAGLGAQTSHRISPVVFMASPAPSGCPVGFSVKRKSAADVVEVKGGEKRGRGPGIEIKLGQKDAAEIVSADVTVRGHSAKLRMLPAGNMADVDAEENFRITGEAAGLLVREIWMHKVNTVSWVDLNEIEYADGSVWRASGKARCRAVPSNFLLVADSQ